jgi:hypothetical protein
MIYFALHSTGQRIQIGLNWDPDCEFNPSQPVYLKSLKKRLLESLNV